MANFETKTIKSIAEDMIAKYNALRQKYNDTTPLLEKAAIKSLCWAFSGALGCVWRSCVWIYKQCFPQTCDLPVLKLWGEMVGAEYIYGQATVVELTISDATAQSLMAGVIYKDLVSGLIYKTTQQADNVSGVIVTQAQCSTTGVAGNLAVGTELTLSNPLDGIAQVATITAVKKQGSNDEEIEHYRPRVLAKFRAQARGGAALDYYNWGMEVSGIADILPYVLTEGIVTLYCVANGSGLNRTPTGSISPNPFPVWDDGEYRELTGSGQFLELANSIEGSEPGKYDRRPLNAKVELKAPVYVGFVVKIVQLTSTAYNQNIKKVLIAELDKKRPNIRILGYNAAGAKINKLNLSAIVSEVVQNETFTDFELINSQNVEIDETTLGIGQLAYLSELYINGVKINDQ